LAEKPLKALEKFRKEEALISWKAMGPPGSGEMVNVASSFSQGL
jgi:hypothetical protein